nr:hypothetical protein [Tanacetum cinerariifolium]
FTTFSNVLFDDDYDSDSSDDQSLSDEAGSDLIESLPNHDSSVIISSKMDSLFDEFAGELTLLKSFPPGIDETNCHPKKEIRFAKRLLYDNSFPHPPKEIVSDISNADIESFSPSPIPNEDSDSLMEEIDLYFNPIYRSLKNCLTIIPFHSLPVSHTILIFLHLIVLLQNHQMEKSPDLLSHLGFEAFQPSAECPMMINGKNSPVLDVPLFHFYPP